MSVGSFVWMLAIRAFLLVDVGTVFSPQAMLELAKTHTADEKS